MNHLIVFMLVIAMYFGLNEASLKNRIEIHNQLALGHRLQYQCRNNINPFDDKVQYLNFNDTKVIEFHDPFYSDKRLQWNCILKHGPNMMYYYDIRVYRAAAYRRFNLLRSWTAKSDGIYYRESYKKPSGHVLHWMKK
ncbi:hypothetical protein EUTSA_v10029524mg [Eutrema salsugineum]|uniref:Uncharacterized protein n=1 Tax=Eutrema salsugineum TaxID=72664 RepID=V4LG32_EUTSA|nr:hypothetical protein EUTSA_v10029524mg [Eutrema salsugineum]